jgi:large subunit ribosomal protein L6
MSRIGKKIITLPAGTTVTYTDRSITVKGPKGTLAWEHVPGIIVAQEGSELRLTLADENMKNGSALWGTTRAIIHNMVEGVTNGYTKSLEINGVGFKMAVQGQKVILNVGFSHPVEYLLPAGITATLDKNVLTVQGIDKRLVGHVAAEIRDIKKPEPYKGKGIKYSNEVIRRKVGKVMKSSG